MTTHHLKFSDEQTALAALQAAGYDLGDTANHVNGDGWGPLLDDDGGVVWYLYDCHDLHASLQQYVSPLPLNPINARAGNTENTVYRCVIVTAAIRDTARAMVVAMAGDTHSGMWSTPVYRDGQLYGYINSGPVRVELAAMLDDAATLAAGTGIPLEQAQYILSQCIVSDGEPEQVLADNGLNLTA